MTTILMIVRNGSKILLIKAAGAVLAAIPRFSSGNPQQGWESVVYAIGQSFMAWLRKLEGERQTGLSLVA